jgi:hypothetical protein
MAVTAVLPDKMLEKRIKSVLVEFVCSPLFVGPLSNGNSWIPPSLDQTPPRLSFLSWL